MTVQTDKIELSGADLKFAFQIGKTFSRSGASVPLIERCLVLTQEGAFLRVWSIRELGMFMYELKNDCAPVGNRFVIVDADSAYACYKELADGPCSLEFVPELHVRQGRKTFVLAVPNPMPLPRDFDARKLPISAPTAFIKDAQPFFKELYAIAQMVNRSAETRPHNFLKWDIARREIVGSDSLQLIVAPFDGEVSQVGSLTPSFVANPTNAWLMSYVALCGDVIGVGVNTDVGRVTKTVSLRCGKGTGVFPINPRSECPDWRLLQTGDKSVSLPLKMIETVADFALANNFRNLLLDFSEQGVIVSCGNVTPQKRFLRSNLSLTASETPAPVGEVFISVQYLLSLVDMFQGVENISLFYDGGSTPLKVVGGNKTFFVMTLSVLEIEPLQGGSQENKLDSFDRPIVINRTGGVAVAARTLVAGDVVERSSDRYLVIWSAVELDLLKLESLDGRWRRTGKTKVVRPSSFGRQTMYKLPRGEANDRAENASNAS